ncbi:glycosyltransferase [Arenicella xantha]|uniref:Cellulose synthase/poly-beta-1,6-N-acetylglucosamine synthase-like glycosyltransferase n=1 Tax=Arenicella xantha TaxID=644221 RepID=A0A395JR83_9GAMM|nr:glycosyltransferase [Arenicella xantha]RBP52966.1 cellulose synthase/poly-beta-1,6-N-acetylglucosamine synthase-like glycosyltransferase [Arenicella xantha]
MISIVIPSNRLDEKFERCLLAIENAVMPDSTELIIVLDGIAKDLGFFKKINSIDSYIIELAENKGPAFARNQGAKYANGEVLLFIDADVAIQKDSIYKVDQWFNKFDSGDALIGMYDDQPSDPSLVSKFRNLLHHYTHLHGSPVASTFWSGFGAIRKEVFWSLGGFDCVYRQPSVEDIELGYRLISAEGNITLDKELRVKHLKSWILLKMIHTDIFRRAVPWSKLLFRFKSVKQDDLNIKSREKVSALLLVLAVVSLIVGALLPAVWLLFPILIVSILVLQARFYIFLAHHFSLYELPLAVFLHWLYYLSAVFGYAYAAINYRLIQFSRSACLIRATKR